MRNEYAVQAASLSEAIHVGRMTADRTAFVDKQERTDMVLAAVAQYVERNFEGGMEATFPGIGLRLTVRVEALTADGDA